MFIPLEHSALLVGRRCRRLPRQLCALSGGGFRTTSWKRGRPYCSRMLGPCKSRVTSSVGFMQYMTRDYRGIVLKWNCNFVLYFAFFNLKLFCFVLYVRTYIRRTYRTSVWITPWQPLRRKTLPSSRSGEPLSTSTAQQITPSTYQSLLSPRHTIQINDELYNFISSVCVLLLYGTLHVHVLRFCCII